MIRLLATVAARTVAGRVEMEVVTMKAVGIRSQHGAENSASGILGALQPLTQLRLAPPVQQGNDLFVMQIEPRNIDGAPFGMFRQFRTGLAVSGPAGITSRHTQTSQTASQTLKRGFGALLHPGRQRFSGGAVHHSRR